MKRVLLCALALALGLAAAAAGCGATQAEDDPQRTQAITAAQVIREFRQAPGAPKLRKAPADPAWEQLNFGLDVPEKLHTRYGVFNVYVVKPGRPQAVDSLLTNKETLKALKKSRDGVYWEYDTHARSYVAYKRYGSNVVLAWWNERKETGTDARWDRLDSLMSDLVSG